MDLESAEYKVEKLGMLVEIGDDVILAFGCCNKKAVEAAAPVDKRKNLTPKSFMVNKSM
jgi:hypothetical protein